MGHAAGAGHVKVGSSPDRVRVLHVVGGMARGGIETWLIHAMRHIDRGRFQMDFAVHTGEPCPYDEEVRALGGRILPCLRPNRPWTYAANFKRVLAAAGPYDIVHSHVHHYSGYVLRLAERAGIPVRIAHSHVDVLPQDLSPGARRRAYLTIAKRWIRRHATMGLACSGQAAQALFGPGWQSSSRCRLLHYGIDLRPFQAGPDPSVRAELRLSADAFVMGHVGRFEEQKNHRFLLEITRRVADVERRTRLVLIGDGSLRPAIERRVAALDLGEHVIFAGLRSDVPRVLLGAVDVFVFPSLCEGLALAGLEAQAAGVPCVLTDSLPGELDVVPQLVTRLGLSQPASAWANVVLATRGQAPSVTRRKALDVINASPFNILTAVAELEWLYATARPECNGRTGVMTDVGVIA
jgi:glycosyltransferase involved in cell wall biosynthesis